MTNETAVVANDFHGIFRDKRTCKLFINFLARTQPDRVVLAGDVVDFYKISSFAKDPGRVSTLQDEIDSTVKLLEDIRNACPEAEIDYIEGNHEDRLRRYLWKQAAELSSLRALELPALLEFKRLNIRYHEDGLWVGDLYITHGSVVRKHAGYTAKAEYDKNGCSGISGHTHRDGKYSLRNRSGHFVWHENYCMCDLNPEYVKGIANWCQGWSYVTVVNNRPRIENVAVIGHKYIYGGRIFTK